MAGYVQKPSSIAAALISAKQVILIKPNEKMNKDLAHYIKATANLFRHRRTG
jgi:hypothetical protein